MHVSLTLLHLCTSFPIFVAIKDVSSTFFIPSEMIFGYSKIIIFGSSNWPSWLALLESWTHVLTNRGVVIHVIVPSLVWRNAFALNRNAGVRWHTLDLNSNDWSHKDYGLVSSLMDRVSNSPPLILYDGNICGFDRLFLRTLSAEPPFSCDLVAILPATRLSNIKRFSSVAWSRIKHRMVGGVSSSWFWLGTSVGLTHGTPNPVPTYCRLTMKHLLEYAPADVYVVDAPLASLKDFSTQVSTCVQMNMPTQSAGVYMAYGLAPDLSKLTVPFQVISTSPFTPSGLGRRYLSISEIGSFIDLSVGLTSRLPRNQPVSAGQPHTAVLELFHSVPVKVLRHAFWTAGLFECIDGGVGSLGLENPSNSVIIKNNPASWVPESSFVKQAHQVDVKAVKSDDADVPIFIWNQRLIHTYPDREFIKALAPAKVTKALNILRYFLLRRWHQNVRKSLIKYLKVTWKSDWVNYVSGTRESSQKTEFALDLHGGTECLYYACNASFWEWDLGSRPFFWRWSPEFQKQARDGVPIYWVPEALPTSRKSPSLGKDARVISLMKAKVLKVMLRGYLKIGLVKSLINYFAVPKGDKDIRMVYDGTASGFNDAVWVPNFGLPTIETLLRGTAPNCWMVDLDIGDMFLNFMLHSSARRFVGIDVTKLFEDDDDLNKSHMEEEIKRKINSGKLAWLQWTRCAMGLKCSPHQTIKAILFVEEFIKGLTNDETNPFHISKVITNLPGEAEYDPSKPWFYSINKDDNMASVLAIYVDDERIHSSTEEGAWEAAHLVSTRESYLGIQDAARKRRPPTQVAGAWAGFIIRTNDTEVGKMVSLERWLKCKSIIGKWLHRASSKDKPQLSVKELLSDRGFLIYVARTYTPITCFLKGLHLTIDSWRKDRDEEGWKIANWHKNNLDEYDENVNGHDLNEYDKGPDTVEPATRLVNDLKVLSKLTEADHPPVALVFSKTIYIVKYTFGDASGGGFGESTATIGSNKLRILQGTWAESMSEKSSNFKELGNFVNKLENDAKNNLIAGAEMFLFTDNTTTESAFYNGTTKSKTLFELIVRLKQIELHNSVKIHLIHVAGKRMIAQGTDGISRGNIMEGVLAGHSMMSFIPIGKSAIDRSPKLLGWIREWSRESNLEPLTPKQWLWEGHGLSTYPWINTDGMSFPVRDKRITTILWAPPPSIAEIAVEELRKSRHKRPDICHVFVCSKLMTPKWRKFVLRTCCFAFYVDANEDHWPKEMYESLFVAVYMPYLHCYPWTFRGSNSILELGRKLSEVQKKKIGSQRDCLCEFFLFSRRLQMLSSTVVRSMLHKGCIR